MPPPPLLHPNFPEVQSCCKLQPGQKSEVGGGRRKCLPGLACIHCREGRRESQHWCPLSGAMQAQLPEVPAGLPFPSLPRQLSPGKSPARVGSHRAYEGPPALQVAESSAAPPPPVFAFQDPWLGMDLVWRPLLAGLEGSLPKGN